MTLTYEQLKTIVETETQDYITKRNNKIKKAQERRKKERERLRNQRKKSWLRQVSPTIEEKLLDIIAEEAGKVLRDLDEDKVMSREKIKKLCYKIGMKTYTDWLKIMNNIERASDGKLFDKPKVKESELLQDKNCGNPYRSKDSGELTDKNDTGIKSTYFCDGEKRKTIKGKSIKSQECGRSARMKGKDIPCHPDNPKNKQRKK